MTGVLTPEIWSQTCTQGGCNVKMEAEIGMMLPEAKILPKIETPRS